MKTKNEPVELPEAAKTIENPAHAIFVAEMILHGDRKVAYLTAYPESNYMSARSSACRLLTRPEIACAIRRGLLEARQGVLQLIKEKTAARLADIEEKRAVLAQIIRGELTMEKETTKNGEAQTVKIKSDPKDRMRAIAIDNKLEEEWNRIVELPNATSYI